MIINHIKFYTVNFTATCLALWLCITASASERADSADISFVIKNETIHRIDPRVFGQFMERPSWGEIGVEGGTIPGTGKLQPQVLKLLEEM